MKPNYNISSLKKSLNKGHRLKFRSYPKGDGVNMMVSYFKNYKHHIVNLHIFLSGNKEVDKNAIEQMIVDRKRLELELVSSISVPTFQLNKLSNSNPVKFADYYLNTFQYKSAKTRDWYGNALKALLKDINPSILITEITHELLSDFIVNAKVSNNTKKTYLFCIRTVLMHAVTDGLIPSDPSLKIKIKYIEPIRNYLTIEEVKLINDLGVCHNQVVKDAFLFSCFTGLRYSDVCSIKWGDISNNVVTITMQKTKDMISLKLNTHALNIVTKYTNDSRCVFTSLPTYHYVRSNLKQLLASVGITRKITFHSARHTFATMLLTLDTDIYTVSKLLGHKDISTTQIYAHMVDKKKNDAIDKLSGLHIG